MQERVNHCLNLIVNNNVDEVVWAFRNMYFEYVKDNYPTQKSYEGVLQRFLNKISQTLMEGKYEREQILENELTRISYRKSKDIAKDIQVFLSPLTNEDRIDFLGELIGAYALTVPEPLFRVAKTYLGLHKTPDFPAIDDKLPMTDDMILFAWQYDWFYTWLGY